ncbi:MAG: cadmium-translocating P-type ATPase [Clostridiales bacterium]|nr:cadmium-translocating P-type ATPase [Clostridiales bacterium]
MSAKQKKHLIRILISACFLILGLVVPYPVSAIVLLMTAYLLAGYDVLKEALSGILRGQVFDENFLMAIATIGALIIGEYAEAVAVMVLYQLGEWFQHYAVGKSRASISDLMQLCPDTATVLRDGELLEIDPYEVATGETLVVKAGEKIPLDGVILTGESSLDTAALTGESLPRDVQPGDQVISGCVNLTGVLHIRAEKEYVDSTVSRILEMVESAADRKSKAESFITRFARVYTPAVCIAALLLFLIPPLFFGGNWADWGHRALSFLVVSCPCALVISVPLSFFGGIGAASRNGILMKGSNELEALAQTYAVVMDKTGTLTKGVFQVSALHPEGISKEELVRMAASAEQHSTHPISRSICSFAGDLSALDEVAEIQETAGEGITCQYEGSLLAVGNARLLSKHGVIIPECVHTGTIVHVALDGMYKGHIVIADELKEGVADTLRSLRSHGVDQLVMLTGDNEANARDIAGQIGVDRVYAGLLPGDKVSRLEEVLAEKPEHKQVVFVGDGINDAPVLMRADVGVAMGGMGSDAAVEAADVVLMDDNPAKLITAIQISRKTLTIARQNIFFALLVKALVLILVTLGLAGMWLAVFADVGVSVLAILNAMRTLRYKLSDN